MVRFDPRPAAGKEHVHYSRRSQTFSGESARSSSLQRGKIAEGLEVSAGTLNPVFARSELVGPSEIEQWLEETCKSAS